MLVRKSNIVHLKLKAGKECLAEDVGEYNSVGEINIVSSLPSAQHKWTAINVKRGEKSNLLHTYMYIYPFIHTYIYPFIHTYIHVYIHTYMYMHKYIHKYIHTYTHTHITHANIALN